VDAPELTSETRGPGRVRQVLAALAAPFAAILVPDRRVAPEVAAGRYTWPLLVIILCASLAALSISARLDLGPEVRAKNAELEKPDQNGAAQRVSEVKTDREIDDETAKQTAVTRVMLGLDAGLKQPMRVLFLALVLFVLGRYVGGTPTMARSTAAAALVALPGAVRSLVTALAAWQQTAIGTADIDKLTSGAALPLPADNVALSRLLGGVDLFTLWSVVILGFALAAAAELPRAKAFIAGVVGFVLYLLVTGLIMGAGS
jgi:hypothetical protein